MKSPLQIQVRAGLIASEFSLLGLGAATIACTALLGLMHGSAALSLLRSGLLAGAGLTTCGLVLSGLGRFMDLGHTRRWPPPLPRTWLPVAVLAGLLAASAWTALLLLRQAGMEIEAPAARWALRLLDLGAFLLALPLLAGLGLRALAAVDNGPPMPIAQLFQAIGHCLLGGVALLMLIGLSSDGMGLELKYYLGASVCSGAAHVVMWSAWLLRGSRKRRRALRDQGVRVPMLERGHALASLALVAGVVLPGLLVLADLVTGRDTGAAIACSVLAVSNHAMRYAWVLLAFDRAW